MTGMWPWPDPTNERIAKLERQLSEAMKADARNQSRIKAVQDVLELHGPAHDEPGQGEADCGHQIIADIRRALEG